VCGAANAADFNFCGKCGAPLGLVCPACGSTSAPDLNFCGRCGTALHGPAGHPEAERAPAQAERRLVTVLFADLVGFTTTSQSRDPEEVRELLSRYFDTCRRLVEVYGGAVEKFIGDAVMAVWGTPVANEDDAERAVRSALDLVEAIRVLGAEVQIGDLRARAAVLSGEAAVTLGAAGEGMVAGDLVNVASRLQGLAPPGAVLVGDATRRLTEAAVVYEDFGSHTVKGRDEPVHAWQALRVVAARGGAQRSAGLEPPFVGRDRELRLLKELFHATAEESRAQLVSVSGISGIGKTRLAWEFFKYVDGVVGTVRWHAGRCLAYGEGVTYWALAEMVRSRAGIVEGEAADSAAEKLARAVEASVPDPEERRWIEPRLAQLVGLAEGAGRDRQDLFAAWRRFFERLAEADPVVMLFEDLQWADPSLLEFIEYLLEWSRDYAIFVITLGRAAEASVRSVRGQSSLHLEPLPLAAMEELITSLVPGLPEDLERRILERAEGVPLYAVETVRMLLDRGLLVPEGGSYRLTGAVDALDVPETLHTLVAARLDGLEQAERELLQPAAVLGKTFTAAAVAAVGGRPLEEVEPVLRSLVRKEMLAVRADPRSPERGQYGFLQDIVRQVAYETLSRRDRKALHLKVAEHLELASGAEQEELVEVLASHYLDAYSEAPEAPDAARIRAQAVALLSRAGERAASLGAAEEAVGYFLRALELAEEDLDRARLRGWAGEMELRRGRFDTAAGHLEQASQELMAAGDVVGSARLEVALGDIAVAQGQLAAAVERLRSAYDLMTGQEPDEAMAVVASQLARMLALMERYGEGAPYVERALQLAEDLLLPEVFSQALNTKGLLLMASDRHQEAALLMRHALESALANGLWSAAFRAFNNLGVEYYYQDRNREGIELCQEALQHTRRLGDRKEEVTALSSQIAYMFALGRWDEALATGAEIRALAGPQLLAGSWLATRFAELVKILSERGQLEEAAEWAALTQPGDKTEQPDVRIHQRAGMAALLNAQRKHREALELLLEPLRRSTLSPRHPAGKIAWPEAFDAALALGQLEIAEELARPYREARPGARLPSVAGVRDLFAGRLAIARGDLEGATSLLRTASATFREGDLPFHQAHSTLELAECLAQQGLLAEARTAAEEARALFQRLGAAPAVTRADRVLGAQAAV
jgi:class 3 adenylate cyclase/tetratricopeptide (TPR) repeat protein